MEAAYVLEFREIDRTKLAVVGGKGANLGELFKLDGVQVPEGFCVTTAAYREVIENSASLHPLLDRLATLKADDRKAIGETSANIRNAIAAIPIPEGIAREISGQLARLGEASAYAVRSSATAEDLPTASFAGQQDTYLNVTGKAAILRAVSKCWASLFTDRAVVYRMQNGFDHRKVHLAVVIQKMIFPDAAGILFTADPVTGHRKVLSIDASFGLGEALVSGLVNADHYKVQAGKVVAKQISTKQLGIFAAEEGGTRQQAIGPERQHAQTLSDMEILALERLGRTIEAHFGEPQDIEWCLDNGQFYIVQSRPITTLYPIPEASDQENHVYISVGHQQMMTDPIKPLGLSFFKLTTRAPMRTAGGRLFVDVTPLLAAPSSRDTFLATMGQADPLLKDALMTIVERGDFLPSPPDAPNAQGPAKSNPVTTTVGFRTQIQNDPTIVPGLIQRNQAALEALKQNIQTKSGPELFDFILEDIQHLKQALTDPESMKVILGAMDAAAWINEHMKAWLGETNAADALSQSVPHNVTSEMGLALLDVADVIRPYPEVIAYLQSLRDDPFLEGLPNLKGGQEAHEAIYAFLDQYGMRCPGEIDITRTRWREHPATLVPLILSNIKNIAPHASTQRFAQGRQEALKKKLELLERLKQLPEGEEKAEETKRMIDLVRTFSGFREYPKYGMVSRYFLYKQALMKEAAGLVQAQVIQEQSDIYYLTFEELRAAVSTHQLDPAIIHARKEAYKIYEKRTPPRVITSDGEVISGAYRRKDLPAQAIAGLPVSSGVVEGRARVIFNLEDADIAEGDILVTPFTDPSWTPVFISIQGLVTEVGGLMTHGAVIAREYGLPAVVGVENATKLIQDGQRIRVNGTEGYIEIL